MTADIALPKLENDSDIVIDKGKVMNIHPLLRIFYKHKHKEAHEVGEQGWCENTCPVTGHLYRHIICCPNKYAIICRGCGKVIY